MGVIAGETEIESGHALAVLVFGGDEDEIRATRFFVPTLRGRAAGVAAEVACRSAAKARQIEPADSLCRYLQLRSRGDPASSRAMNCPASPIAGGGASEDGSIGETFVFCGDTVSSNAVSGMLLAGDFDLTLANTIACGLIGTAHRVTAARDNMLDRARRPPGLRSLRRSRRPARRRPAPRASHTSSSRFPCTRTRKRSSAATSSCAISSAPARNTASSQSRFQPQIGDTVGFVLRDAERSREDLKATLDEVSDRLKRHAARLRPLFRLRLARRRPLQHPRSRLRLHQTRARPHPDRRLLHRLRNRRPRRSDLLLQYSGVLALISGRKSNPEPCTTDQLNSLTMSF